MQGEAADIVIAAALIDDGNGRLLLVRKRGTTAFMQAGGKIEAGEAPFEALARELGEELNFTPAQEEARFLGCFCAPAANEPGRRVEAHLFHVRAQAPCFRIGAELEEAVWIYLDSAQTLPLAPLTREAVLPLARALCA